MKHHIALELTDHQVTKLRELMDALPLSGYADLIAPVLKALPLENESAAANPSTDATPASSQTLGGAGVGFSLTAFTDKGKAALPALTRLLGEEHPADFCKRLGITLD